MAASALNVVDLQYIFSAPLVAVIEADFMAAQKFLLYLEKVGFEHPKPPPGEVRPGRDEDLGHLRMVEFEITQLDQNGIPRQVRIRLPMLSLVPLPLLHIKDASFEFAVRLLEAIPHPPRRRSLNLLATAGDEQDDPNGDDPDKFEWRAMLTDYTRQHTEAPDTAPYVEANLWVKLNMAQSDVPSGILKLISIMNDNSVIYDVRPVRPGALPNTPT